MGKCKRLLLISLDAVTCDDAALMASYPDFSGIIKRGTLVTGVNSVFVSNTYPAHASIVTGLHPAGHGLVENTLFFPGCCVSGIRNNNDSSSSDSISGSVSDSVSGSSRSKGCSAPWRYKRTHIQADTLYDKAAKAGLTCCSILFPSTGGARGIRYNIPEIPGDMSTAARAALMLLYGSPVFVISSLRRFGGMLKGTREPELDDFSTAAAADAIIRHKPGLLMLHLIDTDSQKHSYGPGSPEALQSLKRHDERLGILSDALRKAGIYDETGFIIFGDHGCLPVREAADPNEALVRLGFIGQDGQNRQISAQCCINIQKPDPSTPGAFFHCAGGTAFLKITDSHSNEIVGRIAGAMLKTPYTARLLTDAEMHISGMDKEFSLGIEAAEGYSFGAFHAGQHGYGLSREGYKVFYLAAGEGIPQGRTISGGCITDICPLAADMLGLGALARSDGINRISIKTID